MNLKRLKRPDNKAVQTNAHTQCPADQPVTIDFEQVKEHIEGLIETVAVDPRLLKQSGLVEFRQRIVALGARQASFQCENFDGLCRYIQNNLGVRLTMGHLEEVSGLSARTLQYRFKQRFNCTPMRWITQQRIEACRQRFLQHFEADTVTSVALCYGFTNLGNFARLYAQQTGELPSETMLNTKA